MSVGIDDMSWSCLWLFRPVSDTSSAAPGRTDRYVTSPSLSGSAVPGPGADQLSARPLVVRREDERLLAARLVAARSPGQWVGAVAVLVLFAMLVNTLVTNPRFQWHLVADYFVNGSVMRGLVLTLWLTAAVMVCGFLLGI